MTVCRQGRARTHCGCSHWSVRRPTDNQSVLQAIRTHHKGSRRRATSDIPLPYHRSFQVSLPPSVIQVGFKASRACWPFPIPRSPWRRVRPGLEPVDACQLACKRAVGPLSVCATGCTVLQSNVSPLAPRGELLSYSSLTDASVTGPSCHE